MTFSEGLPAEGELAPEIDQPAGYVPAPGPEPKSFVVVPEGMVPCGEVNAEGHACLEYFDTPAKAGVHRWNVHQVRSKKSKRARDAAGGPSGDKAPPSVTINLGGKSSSGKGGDAAELAAVEKRAQELVTTVAGLALLVGAKADAADLQHGSAAWAKAVRDVAEYEEWLRKMAKGGETTGRALAWFNLALATAALAMPSLLRHGVLPDGLADYARQAFTTAQGLSAEGDASAQAV
jgi:hypothetical protein